MRLSAFDFFERFRQSKTADFDVIRGDGFLARHRAKSKF